MNAGKREQAYVGVFVLLAAGLLFFVTLAVSGSLGAKGNPYRVYFRDAAGLHSAAVVRYGGLLAGKVDSLRVDPNDSSRIEVTLRIRPEIPVKTDSHATITSLGALGESYVEIAPGSRDAPRAEPGSVLASRETMQISDVGERIGEMLPAARQTLESLNDRLTELKITIAQVNDLLGGRNRENVAQSLATLNAMLTDARPKLAASLGNLRAASDSLPEAARNLQTASGRVAPLLDDLKGAVKQASEALANVNAIAAENRPDIRAVMLNLRKTVDSASQAAELLRAVLYRNDDNLDEILANVRLGTENLKQLSEIVRRKPSILIRGETGKDRRPGAAR